MVKDNLRNLKWRCYSKEGIVEISNERQFDNVDGEKCVSEDINSKVDSTLIDVLEELYYVVALENIDSNENDMNKDKEILFSQLEQREQRYNALLRLKQMYYTEVQTSIERINMYCDKGIGLTNENADILREIERLYIDLSELHYWRYSYLSELHYWRYSYIRRRLAYENLSVLKKLVNALIDLAICYEKNDLKEYNEVTIKQWMELFLVLRNREFGVAGEIAWLLCLLNIFRQTCLDSEDFEWTKINLEGNWERELNQKIEQTNALVENVFERKICDMQKDLLMCYLERPMSSDSFDVKIEHLVKALQQLSKMKEYEEVQKKYLDKKSKSCIAIMHSNSKRYVALSGSEVVNKYSMVLKRILGYEYQVVELNSEVRYYHTKKAFITYGTYNAWKNVVGFDESKISNIGLMFSCCERKLLTELYGKGCAKYTIYVKKKVCGMCKKAIENFDEVQKCEGLIRYPQKTGYKGGKISNSKLDEIAKAVRDGVLPDKSVYS